MITDYIGGEGSAETPKNDYVIYGWPLILIAWNSPFLLRFRALGRLESKYDETMVEYYLAFMAMCKRVAGLPLSEEEGRLDVSWLQNASFSMFSTPNICPCHRKQPHSAVSKHISSFSPLFLFHTLSPLLSQNCSNQSFLFAFPEAGK